MSQPRSSDDATPARVRPEDLAVGFAGAADVVRSLLRHTGELDTADLPVVDGDTVRIVSLAEVESWLHGCAVRLANGEIL